MKAILLRAELGDADIVNVEGLDDMQQYVEGYIELVASNETHGIVIYVNEEGIFKFGKNEQNVNNNLHKILEDISDREPVKTYGPALIVSYDEKSDVTENTIEYIGSLIGTRL